MTDMANFSGYLWAGERTTCPPEVESFSNSIDWDALCRYASKLHNDEKCTMDSQVTKGGRYLVRLIKFENGTRWIARFRIPSSRRDENDAADRVLQQEVDCLQLVKERTNVPVPTVFGYIASPDNDIGGSFLLMECLSGNAAIDLQRRVSMSSQQRKSFYGEMARFQVELSSITFPKIGTLTRREDGTWDIGPLPGLGGPFHTAAAYLEAWADSAEFPHLESVRPASIWGAAGKIVGNEDIEKLISQLETSTLAFPARLKQLASTISIRNHGPFPLIHPGLASWNIVVDDDYKVFGVIDWEFVQSGPWEMVHFPANFMPTPAPMDVPEYYDDMGMPLDDELKEAFREMEEYVDVVRQTEKAHGLSATLSSWLSDRAGQDLGYALKLYIDGKHGYYSKILDAHSERWAKGNNDTEAA